MPSSIVLASVDGRPGCPVLRATGLLLAAVLKAKGLTVIISEISQARKEMATSTGVADHVLDPSETDVATAVRELTGGQCVDVGFECSSVDAVLDTLLDAVRPGGVVVNVSIWGHPATVDMQKLVLKEIDLRGTIAYANDHPATIKLVQKGKVSSPSSLPRSRSTTLSAQASTSSSITTTPRSRSSCIREDPASSTVLLCVQLLAPV